jgi:hypothetical protein
MPNEIYRAAITAFHLKTLTTLLAFFWVLRGAAVQEFTIEPIPDWTSHVEIKDYNNPLEKQASAGVFYLLFDVEVNGATQERYIHVAKKFLSSSGVEANSRLLFNFDPAYQKLILHKIVIHRGDEILDELNPEKIRVIQQEKDLDRLIYNGAKTALMFLEDVRVGDWVESAFTVRGRNPVESGHYYEALQLQWPFPIQSENYRLLWPRKYQPLWVQMMGHAPQNRNLADPFYEYSWHWENRPFEEMEDFIPVTVLAYPMVHFSDFETWKDVAGWAAKSFRSQAPSIELRQRIAAFKDGDATDEQRVVRALQFVQDDIRYLGIENGVNSHVPTDPSVVFARGYGDCKDKALLLCTILNSLGVEARPVLVSTWLRDRVKGMIASPLAFDHVIVQVICNGGTNYVDVTRSYQRGLLDQRYVDNYGTGLLVSEDSPGLVTIPPTKAGMPLTKVTQRFDIPVRGPVQFTVEKTFVGRDADLMRQQLALVTQDSMDKNALAYYGKYYPQIGSGGRTEVHDNEEANQIQIVEHYGIRTIWKPGLQTNLLEAEFRSGGILECLLVPLKKERTQPLAVLFPENIVHEIQINTHEPWRVVPTEKNIKTKGFLFHHQIVCTNNQINIFDRFTTLNIGIAAVDVPEYVSAVDEIPRYMSLTFSKPVPGLVVSSSPNWSLWMAVVSYSMVLLFGMAMIYRYQPKSPPLIPSFGDPQLQGLGGWLILIGIALIGAIIFRAVGFARTGAAYSTAHWRAITDTGSALYDPLMPPLLLYELFFRITLFCYSILLVVLYFQKRRIFPALMILYLCLQFVFVTLDAGLYKTRKEKAVMTGTPALKATSLFQTIPPLIIWSLYFMRSKRVKLTFVN